MLTEKYSTKYRSPVDDLKERKLVAKMTLKLPAAQTAIASNSWTSPLSGGSADGNRASSPIGQRPDRTDDFWQLCCRYLGSLGLDFDPFDPAHDRRYTAADPPLAHAAGSPYEVPIGWVGFGLRVPAWCDERDVWGLWHTAFCPCPPLYLPTVLRT